MMNDDATFLLYSDKKILKAMLIHFFPKQIQFVRFAMADPVGIGLELQLYGRQRL